jgi:hypothetical protein
MRTQLVLVCAILLTAACSSPKYTYNFDRYNYNSGKKQQQSVAQTKPAEEVSPLAIEEQTLTASTETTPVALSENNAPVNEAEAQVAFEKKYKTMSKAEKKEFRKELVKEMKSYAKAVKKGETVKTTNNTKAMDHDLKLGIIFGAVGFTLVVLGGINTVFWVLGVISLVIGVVFFINWLVRQ